MRHPRRPHRKITAADHRRIKDLLTQRVKDAHRTRTFLEEAEKRDKR